MKRQIFGNTWWGKEWLNALTHIDCTNRIPRGLSYARNGSVFKTEIKGGCISAKVRGHYCSSYNIQIKVPQISKGKRASFISEIQKHPAILAQLSNHELSPVINDIADQCGIRFFPKKWSDLSMHCDCPDFAVPCKHLAAVIYKICEEIDNNPFLILNLYGINLSAPLADKEPPVASESMAMLKNLFLLVPPDERWPYPAQTLRAQDLTIIPHLTERIPELLADAPAFDSYSNFKECYKKRIKQCTKRFVDFEHQGTRDPVITKYTDCELFCNDSWEWELSVSEQEKSLKETLDFDTLRYELSVIPQEELPDYKPSIVYLHTAFKLASALFSNGAIVPSVYSIKKATKEKAAFIWTPAMFVPEVAHLVDELDALLPESLVTYGKPAAKRGNLRIANQGYVLLCGFISSAIKIRDAGVESPWEKVFFADKEMDASTRETKTSADNVNAWLSLFSISSSPRQPALLVCETSARFKVDVYCENVETGTLSPVSALWSDSASTEDRALFLKNASKLSPFIKGIAPYLDSQGKRGIFYSYETFPDFIFTVIPLLRLLKISVRLPKSLEFLAKPKAVPVLKMKSGSSGKIRLDELLDFDWKIAIGNQYVSEKEFLKLTKNARGLIKYKSEYFFVDAADLERIYKTISSKAAMPPAKLLQIALAENYNGAAVPISKPLQEELLRLRTRPETTMPKNISATLRPYQLRGFNWLLDNYRLGFGSVLADDMGLGKTLQTICFLQQLKNEGRLDKAKALIIVPVGLLQNWMNEFSKFASGLSVSIYHGLSRDLSDFKNDVLLTTYSVIRKDFVKINAMPWESVIIDEAQNIKNKNTAQSKAIRSISAKTNIALSGTPVENRLMEFWSIMSFCNPGLLGDEKNFSENFEKPIQESGDAECAARFRKITAPFLLRRLKSDKAIISDLPDKLEQNEWAALMPSQAALYKQTLKSALKCINECRTDDAKQIFKRKGLILQMILALKQICNHPAQFLKSKECLPELSGKTEMLLELLQSILDSGEKALIFTQFTEMGSLLQKMITDKIKTSTLFYHGGLPLKRRTEITDAFEKNPADKILILSLKAGGTGLNLTAASQVIHFDLWWNPAVEAQATDRAYRIGQKKNVAVHRFITKNTFEEKINAMIESKKALVDLTVAAGESWITNLSDAELSEVFSLRGE